MVKFLYRTFTQEKKKDNIFYFLWILCIFFLHSSNVFLNSFIWVDKRIESLMAGPLADMRVRDREVWLEWTNAFEKRRIHIIMNILNYYGLLWRTSKL